MTMTTDTASLTVPMRVDRYDGGYGFNDPAVPASWSIEEFVHNVTAKLRLPTTDVTSGKPLRYSVLRDGDELPRDETIGKLFAKSGGKVQVVHEYSNAR